MRYLFTPLLALLLILSGSNTSCYGAPQRLLHVQEIKSEKGLHAWLLEDSQTPVITIQFTFKKAGEAFDESHKKGLSRLSAALIDEGAGELDAHSFKDALEDLSSTFTVNSHPQFVTGTLTCLARNLDKTIPLIREALLHPRVDEEPFERIKSQIIDSLEAPLSSPSYIAERIFSKQVLQSHPLSEIPKRATVETITREEVKKFLATRLTRQELIVTAVGNISSSKLSQILDTLFASLPLASESSDLPPVQARFEPLILTYNLNIPQSQAMWAHPGVSLKHPDFIAFTLLNCILGKGDGARLFEEVRVKRGLAYSVGTTIEANPYYSMILGSVGSENSKISESINIIRQTWLRLQGKGVTEKELEESKSYLIGSVMLNMTNSLNTSTLLHNYQCLGYKADYINQREKKIKAVTLEQINQLAKTLLDPNKLTFIVLGQPEGLKNACPVAKEAALGY